jgi:hypothetical protein
MASYERYNTHHDTYPPQQFTEQNDGAFNPYDNSQPHRSYEQGGYGYPDTEYRDDFAGPTVPAKEKDTSPYASTRMVQSRYTNGELVV